MHSDHMLNTNKATGSLLSRFDTKSKSKSECFVCIFGLAVYASRKHTLPLCHYKFVCSAIARKAASEKIHTYTRMVCVWCAVLWCLCVSGWRRCGSSGPSVRLSEIPMFYWRSGPCRKRSFTFVGRFNSANGRNACGTLSDAHALHRQFVSFAARESYWGFFLCVFWLFRSKIYGRAKKNSNAFAEWREWMAREPWNTDEFLFRSCIYISCCRRWTVSPLASGIGAHCWCACVRARRNTAVHTHTHMYW